MSSLTLDTEHEVYFYEQDFYVLSNFSSFKITWRKFDFMTSEHAYQWAKFGLELPIRFDSKRGTDMSDYDVARGQVADLVRNARSAHDAFKLAQEHKEYVHDYWPNMRVMIMYEILWAKVNQHEYVKKKLLETGDRRIVENSWRDDFWGWGMERNGANMLGKLWMHVRDVLNGVNIDYPPKE